MVKPVTYHLGDFPPKNIDWEKLIPHIGRANAALARFDGLLAGIPNSNVLLAPLVTQEAVLSSKIEGTVVTLAEVLEYEADLKSKISDVKRDDFREVINYRNAITFATEQIQSRPFSLHLLRETHDLLMQGVRGEDKAPGSFRNKQNWIGSPKSTIDQAKFIPVGPQYLSTKMDEWIEFYHKKDILDPLVQLAIVHLEFEALHPFLDGNGRIGRILIPIFLFEREILGKPNFYMSGYLESQRDNYIEEMREVSNSRDWTNWCKFFLEGITRQAIENQKKAESIFDLYQEMNDQIATLTRSQFSGRVVDFLISFPIFTGIQFSDFTNCSSSTGARIIDILCNKDILTKLRKSEGRKANIYIFPRLLSITEN